MLSILDKTVSGREVPMQTARLLLPFTHGIDMDALEYAVLLSIVYLASKENKKLPEMLEKHLSNWIPGCRKRINNQLQMRQVPEEKAVRGDALSSHPDTSELGTTARH